MSAPTPRRDGDIVQRLPTLVVLHGLDEVAQPAARAEIVREIEEFAVRLGAGAVPPQHVVTTRPINSDLAEPSTRAFRVLRLARLDETAVNRLPAEGGARRWASPPAPARPACWQRRFGTAAPGVAGPPVRNSRPAVRPTGVAACSSCGRAAPHIPSVVAERVGQVGPVRAFGKAVFCAFPPAPVCLRTQPMSTPVL